MVLLSYKVSAPATFDLYGSETLAVLLPALTTSVDLRTSVKLVENGDENFVLSLVDLRQKIVFNHAKLRERFLDERLPMSASVESVFNIQSPQLINMADIDNKILQFLSEVNKKTYDHNVFLAVKSCLFLYSGILSPFFIEVKPMIIQVKTQIKPDYLMGFFESYCVALAGTFMHYLKYKTMEQGSKEMHPKKMYKFPKITSKNFSNFTEEDKHCIRMWAYCATYFKRHYTSGGSTYCSTYGGLCLYTPKKDNWDPETEIIQGSDGNILLVDTGVSPCTEAWELKNAYKERYQGLYQAWCLLLSKISTAAAKCLAETEHCELKQNDNQASTSNKEEMSHKCPYQGISPCDIYMQKFCYVVHNVIRGLKLSHNKAEEVLQIAYNLKLRGCLIGSSCGGMVYILLPSSTTEETTKNLKDAYKKANFKYTMSSLGTTGLTLHTEDVARNKSSFLKK